MIAPEAALNISFIEVLPLEWGESRGRTEEGEKNVKIGPCLKRDIAGIDLGQFVEALYFLMFLYCLFIFIS